MRVAGGGKRGRRGTGSNDLCEEKMEWKRSNRAVQSFLTGKRERRRGVGKQSFTI